MTNDKALEIIKEFIMSTKEILIKIENHVGSDSPLYRDTVETIEAFEFAARALEAAAGSPIGVLQ